MLVNRDFQTDDIVSVDILNFCNRVGTQTSFCLPSSGDTETKYPTINYDVRNDVLHVVFRETSAVGTDIDSYCVVFNKNGRTDGAIIYDFLSLLESDPERVNGYFDVLN